MSAFQIFTQPSQQALDTAANVLSGATLTFSLTGTSTPTDAYADDGLDTPLANPLSANAAGVFVPVFLDPDITYRVVLKTAAGAVLQTWDPANERLLSQASIGAYLYPRTSIEIGANITPSNYAYPPYDARRYGVTGDGITDDGPALQRWLDAIPLDGEGFLPAAAVYYRSDQALTRTNRLSIRGEGLASRIHYTDNAVAFTIDDARFCQFRNWYLTGTSSATGGLYIKEAQEGFHAFGFYCDGFTGANAYAGGFSDCWDVTIVGGAFRQSTFGIVCDTADLGATGINNVVNIISCDLSATGIGADIQSGDLFNIVGCDFTNDGGLTTAVAAIEVGRGLTGSRRIRSVNIVGNWFEGSGAGVRVGRDNTSSNTPDTVEIRGNFFGNTGDQIRLYKAQGTVIGSNLWGSGAIIIDSGVLNTRIEKRGVTITDNATFGETRYFANDTVQIDELTVRAAAIRVHRNGTDQSINSGAATKVQWTTEDLDRMGNYDSATNYRVTPARSGWYRAKAQVTLNNLADTNLVQLSIYKNGSRHRYKNHYAAAAGAHSVEIDSLVQANGSTDYFEVFVEHNNGSARDVEGDTEASWFEMQPAV